ncbi:putative phosphoribulokinase [Gammaproteobacteria bacterium]
MSVKHPIIAVTGSSGAGTSTVKLSFEHIFERMLLSPLIVEGDSFHRYDRAKMKVVTSDAEKKGETFSHFGPQANLFKELEGQFRQYGETGSCMRRYYLHSLEEADAWNEKTKEGKKPGEFTEWEHVPVGTDLLFYEGLHGAVVDANVDVSKYADLKIGVVPIVNLEWIQKIHRDTAERGYSAEAVTQTILRRMHDYVHYITPQFSLTDINFQRVPLVDTSNPFISRDIPTPDESMVVIRFHRKNLKAQNFPYLLAMIHDSFMSRPNNLVIPGGKMGMAMELILTPLIEQMLENRNKVGA